MMKAELRIKSVGTKVTEAEYGRLDAAAKASGQTLAEWVREVLLASVGETRATVAEKTVLAEVLGLRTILLNLFYKLAKGEAIIEDKIKELIERADAGKLPKAQERLEAAAKKSSPGV
ncbi:MAG: hypothetical protein ACRD1I_08065 [Terriglobia bacterium]